MGISKACLTSRVVEACLSADAGTWACGAVCWLWAASSCFATSTCACASFAVGVCASALALSTFCACFFSAWFALATATWACPFWASPFCFSALATEAWLVDSAVWACVWSLCVSDGSNLSSTFSATVALLFVSARATEPLAPIHNVVESRTDATPTDSFLKL